MTLRFPLHERHGFPVPSATADPTDSVVVSPGLNHLIIPPEQHDRLGEAVGVLEFPLSIAGLLQRTRTAKALQRLKEAITDTLFHCLDGTWDPVAGIERIYQLDSAATTIQSEFAPVARTCLHIILRHVFSDTDFIEWYIDTYAQNNESVSRDDLETAFDQLCQRIEPPHPSEAAAQALAPVREQHGLHCVEAVIGVSLNPPNVIGSLDELTFSTSHSIELNLESRVESVVAALDSIGPSPRDLSSEDLWRALCREVDDSQSVEDVCMFTLDDPSASLSVGARERLTQTTPVDLAGTASGLAWLLTRLFERHLFGAAIYRLSTGQASWLTNPWIDVRTDTTGSTFANEWERTFFADRTMAQLLEIAATSMDSDRRITCPLCQLRDEPCGRSGCTFESECDQINNHKEKWVTILQDLYGEDSDIF